MIVRGLGVAEVPAERDAIYDLLASGPCVPALPYDLTFPEVFYPTGVPHGRRGFHAVVGNPPWDEVQAKSVEFLASFDFLIAEASTERERSRIRDRILTSARVNGLYQSYLDSFEQLKRSNRALFEYQLIRVDGDLAGRQLSLYRVFLERKWQVVDVAGRVGAVVPAAFHANEGATGVRQLYIERMALHACYSFENRRRLFDIHRSFKFCLIVAEAGRATESIECGFYLVDDAWLFQQSRDPSPVALDLHLVRGTGGKYLTLTEFRSASDAQVARTALAAATPLGEWLRQSSVTPCTSELPMLGPETFFPTADTLGPGRDPRDAGTALDALHDGFVALHEGKTFEQYNDHWGEPPRYVVRLRKLSNRPRWLKLYRYFRVAYREVAASTNERTGIFCIIPPPAVTARNAASDITPASHPNAWALLLCAWGNSFTFDYILRQMVQTAVSLFIVERMPIPWSHSGAHLPLVHWSVRLSCNHTGYEPLWHEQLGDAWREPGKERFTWPVLATGGERWEVRSVIDAVVADAYGLNREQYEHVLRSFDRASGPNPHTDICLAKFDELNLIGLDAFTRKYDPYWDIPLVETLPEPVIELPIPRDESSPSTPPTNLLGEPVPTDLYGNPQLPGRKKGHRGRPGRRR